MADEEVNVRRQTESPATPKIRNSGSSEIQGNRKQVTVKYRNKKMSHRERTEMISGQSGAQQMSKNMKFTTWRVRY